MTGNNHILFAFLLTGIAGLATGLGSCIAFFFRQSNRKFLSLSLGFSGGVMIYISFAELLRESQNTLEKLYGGKPGAWISIAAFFGGIALAMAIDRCIPEAGNPHEFKGVEEMDSRKPPVSRSRLLRNGFLFALAVGIHNFPEGMAVFMSTLSSPATGLSIALAIAIHNIPEGITVSVPIYQATGSRKKAFIYSLLSGLAEPLGALCAYCFLMPFLSEVLLTVTFAVVAGIMVFLSFDELLPLAEEYGEHHLCIYGLISGMLIMALTLAM